MLILIVSSLLIPVLPIIFGVFLANCKVDCGVFFFFFIIMVIPSALAQIFSVIVQFFAARDIMKKLENWNEGHEKMSEDYR